MFFAVTNFTTWFTTLFFYLFRPFGYKYFCKYGVCDLIYSQRIEFSFVISVQDDILCFQWHSSFLFVSPVLANLTVFFLFSLNKVPILLLCTKKVNFNSQ